MGARWESRTLGEVSNNFDSVRVPVKEADRRSGSYPYYGASGVVDHIDGYLFDGEYLLIAEDGENLRTRQTPVAFLAKGKFWVNNHAHIIRGNALANTRFLMYALRQADIAGYLTGSTMPKLTQGNLNRIPLTIPPLPVQESIADILGTLDDKIELNHRMNETLDAMTRAVFKSWFVDFDPVTAKSEGRQPEGMDIETAKLFPSSFVDAEIGRVPKGWMVKSIGESVAVVGGSTPSTTDLSFWNGTHCFCTPKDLSALSSPVLLDTERKITDKGVGQISSGLLPVGTVLLSSRAPIGYLAINEVPTAVNQGFIAMICDKALPNMFVLRWAEANMDVIEGQANGTTFMEVSKTAFRPIEVVIPSAEILAAFVKVTGSLHARVVSNLKENAELATARDALLPKLLSGDLRVSPPNSLREAG